MNQGRPTDYTPELLAKAKAYRDKLPKDEVIHSIEGLSLAIGIARSTIYKWRDEEGKESFSDILDEILALQAHELLNNGLKGKFQPTITKVILTKHGYREGHEHTGKDGEELFDKEAKQKGDSAVKDLLKDRSN